MGGSGRLVDGPRKSQRQPSRAYRFRHPSSRACHSSAFPESGASPSSPSRKARTSRRTAAQCPPCAPCVYQARARPSSEATIVPWPCSASRPMKVWAGGKRLLRRGLDEPDRFQLVERGPAEPEHVEHPEMVDGGGVASSRERLPGFAGGREPRVFRDRGWPPLRHRRQAPRGAPRVPRGRREQSPPRAGRSPAGTSPDRWNLHPLPPAAPHHRTDPIITTDAHLAAPADHLPLQPSSQFSIRVDESARPAAAHPRRIRVHATTRLIAAGSAFGHDRSVTANVIAASRRRGGEDSTPPRTAPGPNAAPQAACSATRPPPGERRAGPKPRAWAAGLGEEVCEDYRRVEIEMDHRSRRSSSSRNISPIFVARAREAAKHNAVAARKSVIFARAGRICLRSFADRKSAYALAKA